MKNANWREADRDTGALAMNPAAMGELAGQAGGALGSVASSSRGTGKQMLAATGEGLRDAGMGAGIGASIGSVIPGIGTVIGGAIGAIGGAVVGVLHYVFSHAARDLTAQERNLLNRGLYIHRTRHLPGAFQDAVLFVYNPTAYRLLRAQGRLPSTIEAQLLKKNAYAAHAAAIDRVYGARIRRELAHLPPELRTLVGVSAVTGHSRELYIALHRGLAERALVARQAAARAHALYASLHRAFAGRARLALQAAPVLAAPLPEGPDAPAPPEPLPTPGREIAEGSEHDPFGDLPIVGAAEEGADASGTLDDLAIALEKSRQSQRRDLRDSWVKDTWLGDFLHLDEPDDRSAPIAPAPAPVPGSGRPPPTTLVPEPDTGAVGRTYTAQGEETPQGIAKRYDALSRERWAAELKTANPERDWTARIYAGDTIVIPAVWPQPFWGAAKERGYLDTSGRAAEVPVGMSDPFVELNLGRARRGTFGAGRTS
jgi:hypothetical protein